MSQAVDLATDEIGTKTSPARDNLTGFNKSGTAPHNNDKTDFIHSMADSLLALSDSCNDVPSKKKVSLFMYTGLGLC